MTEMHVMEVRWSGDGSLGSAMAEVAKQHGHEVVLEINDGQATLTVKVDDSDLQALRDRVDELLVALSALEETHNG